MTYQTLHGAESTSSIPMQGQTQTRGADYDAYERTADYGKETSSWGARKWWITGGALLLLGGIAGGVSAGVIHTRNSSNNSSPSSSGGSSGSGRSSGSDPSNFSKDSNLHMAFPGICYTPPNGANYPTCGDTLDGVIEDIQLMSQVTKTIRMYGSDCSASDFILDAIKQTKTDLKVFLGIYFQMDDSSVFDRQLKETLRVIQLHGSDHVAGITVGNEVILQAQQGTAFTITQARDQVLDNVKTTRDAITALNLPNTIPIGTGDAGSMITLELAEGVDYIMSNNQPFFSGNTIEESAAWTTRYTETDTPSVALRAANKPTLYIGEVGWPTNAYANGSLTMNGSAASLENAQILLDTFVCLANQNNTHYFWFQSFNADWTTWQYGGAEPFWGLWDSAKKLKNLKIPDCAPNFENLV